MVGVELGHLTQFHPFHAVLFQQLVVIVLHVDQSAVGYGNHAFTRVAVNGPEGGYLFHVDVLQTRQLEQYPMGGLVNTLIRVDEATVE